MQNGTRLALGAGGIAIVFMSPAFGDGRVSAVMVPDAILSVIAAPAQPAVNIPLPVGAVPGAEGTPSGNFSGIVTIRHDMGSGSIVQAATSVAMRARLEP